MRHVTLFAMILLTGCAAQTALETPVTNSVPAGAEAADASPEPVQAALQSVEEVLEVSANRMAVIETTRGTFEFELFEQRAPITAGNFIELAGKHFYDGLTFHRYVPGFVIQGGDPRGNGTGGSDKTIPLEIHPELRHVKGAVAMARSQNPDSASSQFYVTLEKQSFLDDNYAVFGEVRKGMDVVESLRQGDRMITVRIQDA